MDFHILVTGSPDPDGADLPDPGARSSITYGFGEGHGEVSSWSSPADHDLSGDGVPDAVRLDFDGDGSVDDAMWDSDGDGQADLAVLDADDDGAPDAFYSDTGRGLWDHRVTDPASAVTDHGSSTPAPRSGPSATDADAAAAEDKLVDADNDRRAEIGLIFSGATQSPARVMVDLDSDGRFDAVLIDDDADGCADVWSMRGQVRFDEGAARD